jgi:hypothetical protein
MYLYVGQDIYIKSFIKSILIYYVVTKLRLIYTKDMTKQFVEVD